MKLIRTLSFFLITSFYLLSFLIGCSSNHKGGETDGYEKQDSIQSISDLSDFALQKADSVLLTLTLDQKIGQIFMPSVNSVSDEFNLKYIKYLIDDLNVGGLVLLTGDIPSTAIISEMGMEAKVPLFISIDAEWGLAMRLKDAPSFPRNGKIKKDADETLMFDYGREVAEECRQLGINMVLGPVVDINGVYKNIIGSRSFGSDPKRVAELGIAYAKGLESGSVVSVAKHFPGHGSSVGDSHIGVAKVNRTISALDTLDFYPFRRYVDMGLTGVMAGHIKVPALTPNNEPAAVSFEILTGLLREEMGFKGLILTDAFNMRGAKGFSATQAIKAGADIILSPSDVEGEINDIKSKIVEGDLDESIIEDRCKNILFVKALFGLWDNNKVSLSGLIEPNDSNARKIKKLLSE